MADSKQFKFVSPGIYVNEIDNSQRPGPPAAVGPVIIGRFARGPSLRPVPVSTFAEFVEQFGNPVPGKSGGDVWRDGNAIAPCYASYAAQAWLASTPRAQIVRLLGRSHDDASTGQPAEAGWKVGVEPVDAGAGTSWTSGSAYGMFIFESGSDVKTTMTSGTLAAIFYLKDGAVELSGAQVNTTDVSNSGSALMVKNVAKGHTFRVLVKDSSGGVVEDCEVGLDPDDKRYIRDRLNTNPTLLNGTVSTQTKNYFLGQTFERNVIDICGTSSAAESHQAVILGLRTSASATDLASDLPWGSNLRNTQPARTGWFIGQDLGTATGSFAAATQQKLFRLEGLDDGEWCQNNVKISIEDVKASTNKQDPYGTFSVNIRKIDDKDGAPEYIERYANCTLNPNAENYIAKKIGDQYYEWTESERRWVLKGNYPVTGRFLRVRMNADVDDAATDAKYLPFGFIGAPRMLGWRMQRASANSLHLKDMSGADLDTKLSVVGKTSPAKSKGTADLFVSGASGGHDDHVYSAQFPKHPMTLSSRSGSLSDPTKTFFGLDTTRLKATDGSVTKQFEASVKDISRAFPAAGTDIVYCYAPDGVDGTAGTTVPSASGSLQPYAETSDCLAKAKGNTAQHVSASTLADQSDVFTLDDLVKDGVHAKWTQGSRYAGTSMTAVTGAYTDVLDHGFNKFTAPMFGGFDGLDILEQEPFRNSTGGNDNKSTTPPLNGRTELTGYAFNSVKMAIDAVSDADVVETNAVCAPGITNPDLTDHMLEVAEGRGDMLAIIDLEGGYVPTTEGLREDMGTVADTISNLKARDINSSYGCGYYPWVQISDTVNNAKLWVPPSVAALGVFSSTDRREELWFAPAGFTRGGLSENGAAGITVVGVRAKLNQKERDKLYDANINPIAQFPAEGIVIFGQKTLQVTTSALDRINVRRLMIFLKREISKIAATTLFDQNVSETWNRFKGPADQLLASVKGRFGLSAYKLVLDSSTTTEDLIERNIMYAKILLAPTRAIEFIALDFVIARNGASFAD